MPFSAPRSRPGPFTPSLLALALSLAGVSAQAEGLAALYEAARDYDAGYLSARATAPSPLHAATPMNVATKATARHCQVAPVAAPTRRILIRLDVRSCCIACLLNV